MRLAGPFAGLAVVVLALSTLVFATKSGHAVGPFTMSTAVQLPTSDGGTEPRYTVTPDGKHYAISNVSGTATVWESDDGINGWHTTPTTIPGQTMPTIDVDLVSMPAGSTHPGRLIATELDFAGINFVTGYSDDGGATWAASTLAGIPATGAAQFADQDRPWIATGPHDRAYLLFHNLVSGTANHNMYVSTSTDGGASFLAPVPITAPGQQANTDLQCADSGGPSNIFVNQQDGRVFAVWGSRSSIAAGGCGASISPGPPEINVVAATRVWVATSSAGNNTTPDTVNPANWQQSLAVDDNAHPFIVGMQLAPGALDSAGNMYVTYPESQAAYPNYDGAAIKYVHATQADIVAHPYGSGLPTPPLNVWSAAVTVAPAGFGVTTSGTLAGHLLPHIVAGGPGQIDMAYFEGFEATPPSTTASWYMVTAQTTDALDTNPVISYQTLNYPGAPPLPQPAYAAESASDMMGACGGAASGFTCNRSTDVWGIALDNNGKLQVAWPSATSGNFGCATSTAPPPCTTWVASQIDGPTIAPPTPGGNIPETPWVPLVLVLGAAIAGGALRITRRRKEL
jgi:hypothetical protein